MTRSEILEKINGVVQDILGNDELNLTETTSPKDVDRWDSISNINIIMTLEGEFNIRFGLGELESMLTVKDIIDGVEHHLGA